ncbi:hypothetical protein F5B22DRAFT_650777 [Xylaria bambusicola]|uniref:uncharacterized protein n=1 Tax=Xylaria bambusicola TaxID=326684 RepID=UPI00200756D6|nr:uncharacterized protein F5B22DRAFT_650777 [Xylaria bambusicola]KAI0506387.1 hypothetical protein F5B22DRAFT_650777 [Xylaria bambusicola]
MAENEPLQNMGDDPKDYSPSPPKEASPEDPSEPESQQPEETERPLAYSPWTARWDAQKGPRFTWKNTIHTGLAPEVPRIDDPVHYLDTGFTADPSYASKPLPNSEDLDILFRTENYQISKLFGLRTWQAAGLFRWVNFDPDRFGPMSGGHLPSDVGANADAIAQVYDRAKIRVDESQWFGFLQKRRWYDWVETIPPGKVQGSRIWSVNDPKVWKELSICFELVNRMFNALIEDRSEAGMLDSDVSALETILFGRIDTWGNAIPPEYPHQCTYDDARVLLSYRMEQHLAAVTGKPCQYDDMRQMSKSQWRKRLEEILGTHLWSFIMDTRDDADAWDHCLKGSNFTSITLINCDTLDHLMNTPLTIAERCAIQVHLSSTIVHELCHAIFAGRFQNYLPFPKYKGKKNVLLPPEPYLDCQGISELGHTMEQQFFGGTSNLARPPMTTVCLGSVTFRVPNLSLKDYRGLPGAWSRPNAPIIGHQIPASWTSKLLAEAFWSDNSIPQKSASFFHRPFTFTNQTFVSTSAVELGEVIVDEEKLEPPSTTSRTDMMIVKTWWEREEIYYNIRGEWWQDEHSKWKQSPWGCEKYMVGLYDFADAFAKKDVIRCGQISILLTHIANWSVDQGTFQECMPSDNRDLSPVWVFHCIGLLMMAAIPIRFAPVRITRKKREDFVYSTYPSREAMAAGHENTIKIPFNSINEGDDVPSSTFYNQIRGTGEKHDFTQMDYLELAVQTLSDVLSYAPAYWSWANALMQAYHSLKADREEMQELLREAHPFSWAPTWPFKIPPYDKRVGRFKDDGFHRLTWNRDGDLVYM